MIYVDDMEASYGRLKLSHMWSDTSLEELYEMAGKLHLKLEWIDNGPFPHFDIAISKRKLAIEHGAVLVKIGTREWLEAEVRARELFIGPQNWAKKILGSS